MNEDQLFFTYIQLAANNLYYPSMPPNISCIETKLLSNVVQNEYGTLMSINNILINIFSSLWIYVVNVSHNNFY